MTIINMKQIHTKRIKDKNKYKKLELQSVIQTNMKNQLLNIISIV